MMNYCQQMQYCKGYKREPRKFTPLEDVKILVELAFNCGDIKARNNRAPYPDARKMFTSLAYINCSYDEGKIMSYIGRHRSSFYHCTRQAENLIETCPNFKKLYYHVKNNL